MRFEGQVFKDGRYWAIEVPILYVWTQGRTKKEAYKMIADAIESLVDKKGFKIKVFPGCGGHFELAANDAATLVAFLLRRQRKKHGLSLKEVAKRLGASSHNAYARYEQGSSVPTVEMLFRLLSAVSPDNNFVLHETGS
jgi:predicted RNase H-like HicB family nuclease/DNA-binding XRE family transcriptional regulator